MNGAKRIRAACKVWYLLCACVSIPMGLLMLPEVGRTGTVASPAPWVLLALAGTFPFVFLIHLLAAIWETLIGMALQQAARTEPRPLPGPGPQA